MDNLYLLQVQVLQRREQDVPMPCLEPGVVGQRVLADLPLPGRVAGHRGRVYAGQLVEGRPPAGQHPGQPLDEGRGQVGVGLQGRPGQDKAAEQVRLRQGRQEGYQACGTGLVVLTANFAKL